MMDSSLFIKKSFFYDSNSQPIEKFYHFQQQLGKGAYGTVYKAKMLSKDSTYRAIKKVSKANVRNLNQLISEIQILKELDHPNIMKLYETYQNDSFLYLVTEQFYNLSSLFEGGELYQHLEQKGEFTQNEAREVFLQMLEAVNYCHLHNICHRDLKPQNLTFLNAKSLNLKLIDFGLAFKWNNNMKKQLKTKKHNSIVGTPYYIAPEILKADYDHRCDIWSLGVILYILVTGIPPFAGDTEKEIMDKIKKFQYSINCTYFPYEGLETQNLSPQIKDLIVRILVPAEKRITLKQIFNHPWVTQKNSPKKSLKLNFKKLSKFTKFSKLKTIAVTYIASQMGEKDIQKLGQLFRQLDVNHDGYLSIEQIQNALKKQKQKMNPDQLNQLLNFIDTDRNGKINYTQFISSCLENSIVYKEENLLSVFKMLDRDNNGSISSNELRAILSREQKNLNFNHQTVEDIMNMCDKNKDGKIDYFQFLQSISDI